MAKSEQWIAREREQRDVSGCRWGIYAQRTGEWLPVFYHSKIEALAAIKGLQMAGKALIG